MSLLRNQPSSEHARHRLRSGFTLIELVVGIGVSSILIAGLMSTVYIAAQTIKPPDRVKNVLDASKVADELRYAIHVTDRSNKMIEFAVADRSGDGQADVIRYEWSGTVGDPLTRSFNNGAAANILADVQEFDLEYEIEQTSEQIPSVSVESNETLFIQHIASSATGQTNIKSSDWVAQYFHPDNFSPPLPPDTISWKITKAEVRARRGTPGGKTWVQIRPATGDNKPASPVLGEVQLPNPPITFSWKSSTFGGGGIGDLSTSQGYCLVLEWKDKPIAARIEHETAVGTGGRLDTQNAGSTWDDASPHTLFYKIHGKYTSPGPPFSINRKYLSQTRIKLRTGADPESRINTSVPLLNSPELLSAFWELDFDQDPRTVDRNFDGQVDWSDWEAPFDTGNLSGGIWYSPQASSPNRQILQTVPNNNFVKPVTLNARYKCTSTGWGTVLWVQADRSGAKCAPLMFDLFKPDANTQELWVGENTSSGNRWDRIYALANDEFIDLRVVINPASDTYSVFINNVFMDTFAYVGDTTYAGAVTWVYSNEASGEFDSFSLRVSE